MKLTHARERVSKVYAAREDPEVAGLLERELHKEVLGEIAKGHPNGPYLASIARETFDIDFPRWMS